MGEAAATFTLERNGKGQLVLKRPGEADVEDVRVRRSFPWSQPGRYVSIRNGEGKELILVEDMAALEAMLRELMEKELERWSFIPRIIDVIEVNVQFGFQQWRVRTDRGEVQFRVQEREDIRFLGDGRLSIKDADGCVYELPSLDGLDEKSRRAIEVLV